MWCANYWRRRRHPDLDVYIKATWTITWSCELRRTTAPGIADSTDGNVRDMIPEFIDAGFEVFNPVQWTCPGMDATELKREFGKQLVFWGGGVDSQHALSLGKPEEVYREVRRMIDIFFSDGTGYIFNGMHNVQANVPTQNMLAMFRAVDDARKV